MSKTVKMANPGTSGSQSLVIPITNVFDGGDYSAQMLIGSNKTPVNIILDTGSSTLAVVPNAYAAASDTDLKPTTLAQEVIYGTGGWIGPVVNTTLEMGGITLPSAPVAITVAQAKNDLPGVDGIMGLAYNALNTARDFKTYLAAKQPAKPYTFPWPFAKGSHFTIVKNTYEHLVSSQQVPGTTFDPYFTELETQGVVPNKFAFYTKRSFVHRATTNKAKIANDPLNQGFFVLGGGEEQTNLFTGSFIDVDVQDDLYYSTNLIAIQVDGKSRIAAQPVQPSSGLPTNSIVDSGTNSLALSDDVFQAIAQSLQQLNPDFITQIEQSQKAGIAMSALKLSDWPNINFIMSGISGNEVTLTCSPQTYWQVNFPKPGYAAFLISDMGQNTGNLSILGLPLMNNYYVVFDRSLDTNGIVRFAPIK